jgi:hypothetical protein
VLVFRDARRVTGPRELVRELVAAIDGGEPLAALLLAAELECALEDGGHESVTVARSLTDAFADAWAAAGDLPAPLARDLVARLSLPAELELRRPEGYAFYALEPRAYARAAVGLARGRRVCVVGVRTVGTSLSAVVRASLLRAGSEARRFTVRPAGHPWSRTLELSFGERQLVETSAADSDFIVVDEGPGLSGSTFLAVAEALERHGVPASRVHLLASRPIEPEQLLAEDAPLRFARFRSASAEPWRAPAGTLDVSGGAWRSRLERDAWPPCWRAHERVKFIELGAKRLHKFSGLAHYGAAVYERARVLADAGFAPSVARAEPGFLSYPWLSYRPARAELDAARAVGVLAEYLAFRAGALGGPAPRRGELEAMARLNVFEATGLRVPESFELRVVKPVISDGRMLPHEWLVASADGFLKTDGAEHGDDHFYPGPVDVAWDLAGASVEWNLEPALEATLVERYRTLTRDAVGERLGSYKLAYAALRLGITDFAARDAADDEERARWERARKRYTAHARRALVRLSHGA